MSWFNMRHLLLLFEFALIHSVGLISSLDRSSAASDLCPVQPVSASDTVTNLLSSQDDGGQLRAVAPLCQEGEGEGLDEDGRDEAVPLFRRNRRPRPGLHIWSPVHLFGSLELQRPRKVVTNQDILIGPLFFFFVQHEVSLHVRTLDIPILLFILDSRGGTSHD